MHLRRVKKFIVMCVMGGFFGLFWIFAVEPNWIQVHSYSVAVNGLSGLRLVYLSDLHVAPTHEEKLNKLIEKVNALQPDIVLLGGDYVYGHTPDATLAPEKIAAGLARLNAPLGIYGVYGNHDGWYGTAKLKKAFEKQNILLLENQSYQLTDKSGNSFYIVGLADMETGTPDWNNTLKGVRHPFILLTHSPDIFADISVPVDLILAGHTHGGQVKLPFWGALTTSSRFGQKYAEGFIEADRKRMIVSRGIGTSILPIRFNCLPEIIVIDML